MRLGTLMIASSMLAAFGAVNTSAQDNCQRFQQDDGTTKVLCQDRKGRWIEQKGQARVKHDPLTKATVVYEGSYTTQAYRSSGGSTRRGEISLGSILGSMILQPVGDPRVSRVKITVNYDGPRISVSVYDYSDRKTYQYLGTRTKGKCEYTITGKNFSMPMRGECDQNRFELNGSVSGSNGITAKVRYNVRPVSFTDLYEAQLEQSRKENERKRLEAECDGGRGTPSACVALESLN